ncbi:MAG: DUF4197 domain-containing protein [Lautropia sp.]
MQTRSVYRFIARRCATLSLHSALAAGLLSLPLGATALDLSAISGAEATSAVRTALGKGSAAAVASLGVENGFLGNPTVRIPLPDGLKRAESVMKFMGKQQQFDELAVSINRAAESAVPLAKPLLMSAIQSMSVSDAKAIIRGGDDAVTRFFRDKTEGDLAAKFLPIVKQTTDKAGLAQQYNSLAGQAASFGAIREEDAKIENYVTGKALAGLFQMIAEQERAIRQDPVGTGSAILKKVFGAR